jgi:hypothetical protein
MNAPLHESTRPLMKALRLLARGSGRLHDLISDLVEDGVIDSVNLPDHYDEIVNALLEGAEAKKAAIKALNKAKPPKKGEPNWFA